MNESLAKYLAGLLDADGSLSFTFRGDTNGGDFLFVGLRMSLASSSAVDKNDFVLKLPELTGMGTVSLSGNQKQFRTWFVSKRADLEMLLPRLIKHMIIKGKHWQWLLEQWRDRRRRDERKGWQCSAAMREQLVASVKQSRISRVGPLKPKNRPTWAWLAGYLDGDGTYFYGKHKSKDGYELWTMRVSALSHINDRCGLDLIQKAFGGRIETPECRGNVSVWTRSVGYQNRSFALDFLPRLAKHSRLKREKIQAMIHHHQQRLTKPGCEKNYCTIDDCGRPAVGYKMCSMHYLRWRRGIKHFLTVSDSLNTS